MPKVFFFSTPAVSVLKILTGPLDKPDYSVPDFVYVLLLNGESFESNFRFFVRIVRISALKVSIAWGFLGFL